MICSFFSTDKQTNTSELRPCSSNWSFLISQAFITVKSGWNPAMPFGVSTDSSGRKNIVFTKWCCSGLNPRNRIDRRDALLAPQYASNTAPRAKKHI